VGYGIGPGGSIVSSFVDQKQVQEQIAKMDVQTPVFFFFL
jgi:hypothetical protein